MNSERSHKPSATSKALAKAKAREAGKVIAATEVRGVFITDRVTGSTKGLGFVEMVNDEAQNAINILKDAEFRGRKLKINEVRQLVRGVRERGKKVSSKTRRARTAVSESTRSSLSQWREQLAYFHENYEKFFSNSALRGKFVAIKNKKLIATDTDEWRLLKKMYRKYPKEYVLVIGVMPAPEYEVLTREVF